MPKRYLYLALYDTTRVADQDLRLHWALILAPAPKLESASARSFKKTNVRYHVTNKNGHWEFERRHVECVRTPSMLGRILLGTVDEKRHLADLDKALRDPRRLRMEDSRWDCRSWVEEVLVDAQKTGMVVFSQFVDFDHLFEFGQRFGEEVFRRALNFGFDRPITVSYPGPGPIPHKIVK